MSPRRLALALAIAWLAGGGAAEARQRSAPKAPPAVAAPNPAADKQHEVAKPAHVAVPAALTCRQYVPAARTTIAVPCPEPAPGAEPPRREHPAPQPSTQKPTRTVVSPGTAVGPTPVDAKRCRRFLPSIGETIAVACDDAGDDAKASGGESDRRDAAPREPSKGTGAPIPRRPYVLADSSSAVASGERDASRSDACDAAVARASLGTVASGNLAELRRGC